MEESYNGFVHEGLPEFVGEDPFRWIIKAERFFQEQRIPSSDKMQWAFMRMNGVVMLWFQSWCQENFDANWTSFAMALMRRFRVHTLDTSFVRKEAARSFSVVVETETLEINEEKPNDKEKLVLKVMETTIANIEIRDEHKLKVIVKIVGVEEGACFNKSEFLSETVIEETTKKTGKEQTAWGEPNSKLTDAATTIIEFPSLRLLSLVQTEIHHASDEDMMKEVRVEKNQEVVVLVPPPKPPDIDTHVAKVVVAEVEVS